jgi:hypothetical protein
MSDSIRRQLLIDKMRAVYPSAATNAAPKFTPPAAPADPVRALRAAGAKLDRTLVEARKLIGSLKTSPTPAATLRKVETIARSAASELSAARRSAAPSTRTARREAARVASTFSAGTAHTFSDALLSQAAVHRSSPEADRAIATAELEKRGFSVSPSGIISKSFRKA